MGEENSLLEQQIRDLKQKGYPMRDIYDLLVHVGNEGSLVGQSMAETYEKIHEENIEEERKRREDLQKKYEQLSGFGYDLKKKDSQSEDSALESFGEAEADPVSFSLRKADQDLIGTNYSLHTANELLNALGTEDFEVKYDNYVEGGGSIEGYDEDYVFDPADRSDITDKLRAKIKEDKQKIATTLGTFNDINRSLGIETNYETEDLEPYDLQNALKVSLERVKNDEEALNAMMPDFVNEEYERYQNDMKEIMDDVEGSGGLGYMMHGFGNIFMNSFLSQSQTQANWFNDEDAVRQLRYHQDMRNRKHQMRGAEAKENWGFSTPAAANAGPSEATSLFFGKIANGGLNQEAFNDYMGTMLFTAADVVPQFVYWGAHSMHPVGLLSMGLQVGAMKNADLMAERPDLSSLERGAVSAIAGVVETAAAFVFRGAEKALAAGLKAPGIKRGITEATKNFLKSGKAKSVFNGVGMNTLSEGFEEGFVSAMEWATLSAVDKAAGRRVEDPDVTEMMDAFIMGAMGGNLATLSGNSVGKLMDVMSHNNTEANKKGLLNAMAEVRKQYEAAEFGSEEKIELRKTLASLNGQLNHIMNEERIAYNNFSPKDLKNVRSLSVEMRRLREMINSGRDMAGIQLNKDQIESLEQRLEAVFAEKKRIEDKYAAPAEAAASEAEAETVTAEDVNETEAEIEEKLADPKQVKENKSKAKPAPEGDELSQEGEQLSMFDETQMKDAPAEEQAPQAEEVTEEAEEAVEEAPAAEQEVVEEAPVAEETEEAPAAEEADEVIGGGMDATQGFDLADREAVGEGEGQVSIEFANTLNKILKGFAKVLPKAGISVKVHNRSDFDRIAEMRSDPKMRERLIELKSQNGKGPVMGFYDDVRNEIILPNDAKVQDVREEFAHAIFLPLVNGKVNPEAQQRLHDELMQLKERLNNKAFTEAMDRRKKAYEKAGVTPVKLREEMIVGFLNYYKDNPRTFKTVGGRIRQIINSAFKAIGQQGPLVLKTDADLMSLAQAFTAASEGKAVDVDVTKEQFEEARKKATEKPKPKAQQKVDPEELKQKPTESDEKFRARMAEIGERLAAQETSQEQQEFEDGMEGLSLSLREGRKEFNYLKDTEVFYTEHPFVTLEQPFAVTGGRYSSPRNQKSIKVKDYFHFRNWFNKNTGNQEVNRITDMFFIKDGKIYNIKKPKPKVDRAGNKVTMPIPLTPQMRKVAKQAEARDRNMEARREASRIGREANEIFQRLPWRVYAHPTMFQPALPDGFEYSRLSGNMMVEFQRISRDNLVAAERLNLSRDEFAQIVSDATGDPGRPPSETMLDYTLFGRQIDATSRPDIFQGTGRTMPGVDGESASGFSVSYSLDADMILAGRGSIQRRLQSRLGNRPVGVLEDLLGKVLAIGGFDRTWSTPENGINSGTNSLEEIIERGGVKANVVTSVADRATADWLVQFYRAQAMEDYKRQLEKDPSIKGKPYVGKLAYGFSVLSKDATFGNPDVFYKVMSDIYDVIEKSENPSQAFKDFLESLSPKAKIHVKRLLSKANSARYPDGNYTSIMDHPSLALAISEVGNGKLSNLNLESIEDIKQAMFMIADPKNHKTIYEKGKKSEMVKLSFDLRKEFFREKFFAHYLSKVKGAPESVNNITVDGLKSLFFEETGFNDPVFTGRPDGVLDAYRLFDYKVDENGKLESSLYAISDGSKGFEGVIMSTLPVGEVKYMQELYELRTLDPSQEVILREEKKRKRTIDKKTGKVKSKTVNVKVRGPISSLPTPQQRQKIKYLNSYSNVILGQGAVLGEGDKGQGILLDLLNSDTNEENLTGGNGITTALDVGTVTAETDQGTFELRKLNGFQRWRNLWIRRLVDKYNDIFDIQRAIEAKTGRLSQDKDFQMKEELMYGKAAQELYKLDKKIDKIKQKMKDLGVALEDLNDFLYAKHVVERNAVIKERIEAENEDRAEKKKKLLPVNEAGSGKTNEWAEGILSKFSGRKLADMEQVEKMVREIQQNTRDTYVKFGLETQETIDAWDAMFDNYVPLAGIAVDEESGTTSSYPTGGAGISVFGPMTKKAKGRKSAAENILAQVIAQNAAAQVKARTNEAVTALYKLAEDNPNPEVWQVLDEASSVDPHVVSVRIDGEQKFIRFKDASYAESLRNMNLPETNLLVKILRAPSNWLRRSFTTLNPEFVVSNFARDIQTAVFNAAAEAEIEGGILNGEKVMGDIIKTVPQALRHLSGKVIGRGKNDLIDRYYEDFKEDGGKTGWAYAKRLNDIVNELEEATSETTKTQQILGVGKNVVDFVEGMNEAFEDSVRLAAYIAARKNGVSREKAAQLAKNITVNFNKHGEWGQALNGVYLFFNASVQGTARMFRTIGTLKPVTRPDGTKREFYQRANTAQIMAAGLSLFSGMVAMMNAGISDEDEDGVLFYDKIPDYVKERNLIIMNPRDGKTYYKIPLPYGFNIFSNIGTVAADVSRGGMDVDKGIYFLGNGLVNAFSPINFGQSESLGRSIAKGGIPTVAKPLFDAWGFNETYFGGPVAAEQLPFGTKRPESSMSFRSPEAVKSFFEWLNAATGGSDRVSGSMDINPDRMWYVFEYFVGGAGNFVTRTGKTIASVKGKFKDSDYDIAVNDIPFARIMYGEQSKYYDHGKYRDNETEVNQLFLELKDTRDFKNPRYNGIIELNNLIKNSEKQLKVLREKRRKARDIKDWVKRSIEVQKVMDQERKIIMRVNKRYDELRKN